MTLPARVRRVVSLSPALTESVCVLQACDRLMGVDRFSNWPAQVATLPKLGSLGSFNVESVAALQPDVVLMASGGVVADRLQKLGVAVLVLSPRRQADVAPAAAAPGPCAGPAAGACRCGVGRHPHTAGCGGGVHAACRAWLAGVAGGGSGPVGSHAFVTAGRDAGRTGAWPM